MEAVSALPVRWCIGALVGRLLHVHVGGAGFAPPHNTHSKRSMQSVWEGRPQRTHLPTEGHSYTASNNHRGDSRGVASVVSLATTRARTRSMQQQQQQQQQQSAQQEGSTGVGTARG